MLCATAPKVPGLGKAVNEVRKNSVIAGRGVEAYTGSETRVKALMPLCSMQGTSTEPASPAFVAGIGSIAGRKRGFPRSIKSSRGHYDVGRAETRSHEPFIPTEVGCPNGHFSSCRTRRHRRQLFCIDLRG